MGRTRGNAFEQFLEILSSTWVFVINIYQAYFDESEIHDPSLIICVEGR